MNFGISIILKKNQLKMSLNFLSQLSLQDHTDKNNIWEITAKCFTINGQEPNTNSIKVNLSKIKGDDTKLPKEYDQMKKDITFDLM